MHVSYTSIPPKSSAAARGKAALPFAPQGKAPPPKQPPVKAAMPSQVATPKISSVPKATRRGGQNLRIQRTNARQQRLRTGQDVITLAHEATRIHTENEQINFRNRSMLVRHMNSFQITAESAEEYIRRTRQQLETYEEEDI